MWSWVLWLRVVLVNGGSPGWGRVSVGNAGVCAAMSG